MTQLTHLRRRMGTSRSRSPQPAAYSSGGAAAGGAAAAAAAAAAGLPGLSVPSLMSSSSGMSAGEEGVGAGRFGRPPLPPARPPPPTAVPHSMQTTTIYIAPNRRKTPPAPHITIVKHTPRPAPQVVERKPPTIVTITHGQTPPPPQGAPQGAPQVEAHPEPIHISALGNPQASPGHPAHPAFYLPTPPSAPIPALHLPFGSSPQSSLLPLLSPAFHNKATTSPGPSSAATVSSPGSSPLAPHISAFPSPPSTSPPRSHAPPAPAAPHERTHTHPQAASPLPSGTGKRWEGDQATSLAPQAQHRLPCPQPVHGIPNPARLTPSQDTPGRRCPPHPRAPSRSPTSPTPFWSPQAESAVRALAVPQAAVRCGSRQYKYCISPVPAPTGLAGPGQYRSYTCHVRQYDTGRTAVAVQASQAALAGLGGTPSLMVVAAAAAVPPN